MISTAKASAAASDVPRVRFTPEVNNNVQAYKKHIINFCLNFEQAYDEKTPSS